MEQILQILRVMVLSVIVLIIYGLVSLGINNNIEIFHAESQLIIQRIVYSAEGINFYDAELDRTFPGMIDSTKFSSGHLQSVFNLPDDDQHLAVKLSLTIEGEEEKLAYLNQEWFDRWIELTSFLGKGGRQLKSEIFPVIYFDKEQKLKKQGILKVEVIIRND